MYIGVMGRYITPAFNRLLTVLFAVAFLGHSGQLHLQFPQGETVSVLMCGSGTHRMVDISFGEEGPPSDTKSECCGDCTLNHDAVTPEAQSVANKAELPIRVLLAWQGEPVHPGRPLWPGAPPIGPPILV
jgi:hypothetical protein